MIKREFGKPDKHLFPELKKDSQQKSKQKAGKLNRWEEITGRVIQSFMSKYQVKEVSDLLLVSSKAIMLLDMDGL